LSLLVDVRSTPYSRFQPQFNKSVLATMLLANSIDYIWEGEALGGRPKDPACYIHQVIPDKPQDYLHEISYPQVIQRPWFVEGIQHLIKQAEERIPCIMCAERDPAQCHRHQLIARYLLEQYPGVIIKHILANGSLVDARSIPDVNVPPSGIQLSF
jgi:uncharacterized protein (DUF488 family)